MRYLLIIAIPLLMWSCMRMPSAPEIDIGKGGLSTASAGDFLVSIGYWAVGAGAVGLILAVAISYFLGSKIGRGVAVSAAGAIGVGLCLIYVGPWLAWIFAGAVVLVLLSMAYLAMRNKKRIIDQFESATGWELDGVP